MDPLQACIHEVEELRLRVIEVRGMAEKRKVDGNIQIQELDQIHAEHMSLSKIYMALRKDLESAGKIKAHSIEYDTLVADNDRLKKQLADLERQLNTCRSDYDDISTSIDIVRSRLGDTDRSAILAVEKAVETLDDNVDMDKIWSKLTKPYIFTDQRSCETKVVELSSILRSIVSAHEKEQEILAQKLVAGEKMKREYSVLRSEYEKLGSNREEVFRGTNVRSISLMSENDAIRKNREHVYSTLIKCQTHNKELHAQYAEFKVRWQRLRNAQLSERSEKIRKLKQLADSMHNEITLSEDKIRKVTFDPSAKQTSSHRVISKPPRRR